VTISATVTPNKAGECTAVEIQEYYSGAWQPNTISGCGTLTSSSKIVWSVDGSQADLGYPYRMRIDFSGDATNGANNSAWQYVMFES
jgi:hypothetical protein